MKSEHFDILQAHKLIKARELKLDRLMTKHLYHSDEQVVHSALMCCRKVPITGLAEHYEKIYWESSQKIQSCILANIRQRPRREYKNLLLQILFEENNLDMLVKVLQAIGSIASRGEIELVEILRERVSVGIRQDIVGEAAIESLFHAGDFEYLSSLVVELYPRASYDWRFGFILQRFADIPHGPSFKKFYSLYQKLEQTRSEVGSLLIIGLLGSYDDSESFQEPVGRVKRLLLHYCINGNIDDSAFLLDIVRCVDGRDQDFLINIISSMSKQESSGPRMDKLRREIFQSVFVLLDLNLNEQAIKNVVSSTVKNLIANVLTQHRLVQDRLAKSDGVRRNNIVEFFENLGHQKLLDLFQTYLKTENENNKSKVVLVTLIKQLIPSLDKKQTQRVKFVLQYLGAGHSARERTSLAVEFSKVDFNISIDRVLNGLDFYLEYMSRINESSYTALTSLYEKLQDFSSTEASQLKILRAFLVSSDSQASKYAFEHCFQLDDVSLKNLFSRLPAVKLNEADFLKQTFFLNSSINKEQLHYFFTWLKSVEKFQDTEWSLILGRALDGVFGELPSGWQSQLPSMMIKFCTSTAQEYFLEKIKSKKYKLSDSEVKVLWEIIKSKDHDIKNKFRRGMLSDFLYKLINDDNEPYLADVGGMLLKLEDEYGKILLYQCLGPEHSSVIKKSIQYCRQFRLGAKWKTIFKLAFSDDFLMQKTAISFFEYDYKEFQTKELMEVVAQAVDGEKFDADSFEELAPAERKHLQEILENLKGQRGSVKRQFARQKDMQELTVFFIDIAGYTNRSATSSIDELMSMLEDFEEIVQPLGETYDGVLIKKIGDCFMYTFDNPMNSILFSLDVLRQLASYNEFKHDSQKINTRIGLATGEVYVKNNDVYGDIVNLASRVEGRAPLDGLLVHESTIRGLESFFEVEVWEPIQVKGIEEAINVFEVIRPRAGVHESYHAQ